MKKLISFIFAFLLLFSCFGIGTFAAPASATLSEDYQELYYDGYTYCRFNTDGFNADYINQVIAALSEKQQKTIDEVFLESDESQTMMRASIYYKDGAILTANFLRTDYVESYQSLISEDTDTYTIDFGYPDDNSLVVGKELLFGEQVTLTSEQLELCDYFPVIVEDSDKIISAYKGALVAIDDNYYYVDLKESHMEDWYDFDPYNGKDLSAHKISDTELATNIESGIAEYYDEDFGVLLDDNFSKSVSLVFLVIVFAIVPLAVFLVFLILAIRSKTEYKKMFRLIYLLSAAELAVFGIVAAFLISAI